jgi:MOSC domain-containing protein YiiM
MHLVSVQLGSPKTVGTPHASDPMERAFTSAIWKEPVAGPVWAGLLGLRGDTVANTKVHGGPEQAILMYPESHYASWHAEWGRDDIGAGAFGENLTVAGLTEDTVCIGDVLEIGAARLQVSQPRQPCATLARRHQMRDMIAQVRRNGRSGWYLRVLQEGYLAAGQPIALAERPHAQWTVRRAAQVGVSRKERPGDAAELAACPALSPAWQAWLIRS